MLSNKTTELSVIRERPNRFTWGRVAKFHDVGPYTLVEFIPDRLAGAPGQAPEFHVYVDGYDTCRSTATLDGALRPRRRPPEPGGEQGALHGDGDREAARRRRGAGVMQPTPRRTIVATVSALTGRADVGRSRTASPVASTCSRSGSSAGSNAASRRASSSSARRPGTWSSSGTPGT